jgi:hypothetical protein
MKSLLFIAAAWLVTAQPASAQIDTSGVDQFWRTADRIAAGEVLTSADWDAFFAHPGYRFTQEAGQRRPVIELCMQAVFARDGDVATALQNRPNPNRRAELYARTCAHMAAARERRAEISDVLASGALDDVLERAQEEAARWLPDGAMQQNAPPRVDALLFEPQGFGRRGEIVIDALYTMQKSTEQNVRFFGHEFHHGYREAYQVQTWSESAAPLMQQLDRLVHEGTASMIDKAPNYRAGTIPFGESETFLQDIRDTPQRLAQIDAVMAALSPTPDGYVAAANAVDELMLGGGHLDGVFMAMMIEEELGRDALIDAIAGPRPFFTAYQRAARARGHGAFVFSNAAMRNLRRAARPAN